MCTDCVSWAALVEVHVCIYLCIYHVSCRALCMCTWWWYYDQHNNLKPLTCVWLFSTVSSESPLSLAHCSRHLSRLYGLMFSNSTADRVPLRQRQTPGFFAAGRWRGLFLGGWRQWREEQGERGRQPWAWQRGSADGHSRRSEPGVVLCCAVLCVICFTRNTRLDRGTICPF